MSDTTRRAVVNVAPRQAFNGYFSAGEFWPTGITSVEVVADAKAKAEAILESKKASENRRFITEAQLSELRAEKQVLGVMTPEQAASQAAPGALVVTDADEKALLEKHRAEKAKKSNEQAKK